MRHTKRILIKTIMLILLVLSLTSCQTARYHGPVSNHFDGKSFYNLGEKDKPKHPWYDLYVMWRAILQNPWPGNLPEFDIKIPYQPNKGPKITFIGHSTFLIETKQLNILTDPVYSNRASPIPFLGPKRISAPGILLNNLPKIDVVVISHNHYDHMDISTLKKLKQKFNPEFIVPIGNAVILKKSGIHRVIELDWWQKTTIKSAIITLLPAKHSSQRSWFDYNKSLWGSYGIKVGSEKIFFAGDTAYEKHFKAIRKKWGKPDLALIPIGAYQPREILKDYHLNPEDAVQSHIDLNSHKSVGMHWGTFQLSSEHVQQPLIDLNQAKKRHGISDESFYVLNFGDNTFIY